MILAPAPLPVTPEMVGASREIKDASKAEEKAKAQTAEPEFQAQPPAPRPAHPDEVGRMVNVEA